ncbi:MAG: nicotinate-nucleotide adenylyltransferase [Gammaproteobacteria bacterium]|nr:nicotinate-nucleotide adenylyltransferase [Gammaproteobacteria bacterium]
MSQLQQPIGILGGTFDPIHYGHLRMALELKQALDLEEVRLTPCYTPVHRSPPFASPEQRLEMVKCAIEAEPALRIETCEIDRKGPSYTVDTLHFLRQKMPHTPLCIIMGIDALLGFSSWHKWEEILTLAHLIVAHRPRYELPQTGLIADLLTERQVTDKKALHMHLAGKIALHPVTALEISSTVIRDQIALNQNVRFLLPDSVYNYIKTHGTYSNSRI